MIDLFFFIILVGMVCILICIFIRCCIGLVMVFNFGLDIVVSCWWVGCIWRKFWVLWGVICWFVKNYYDYFLVYRILLCSIVLWVVFWRLDSRGEVGVWWLCVLYVVFVLGLYEEMYERFWLICFVFFWFFGYVLCDFYYVFWFCMGVFYDWLDLCWW